MNKKSLFLTARDAAQLLGFGIRQFRHNFVETGHLRCIRFKSGSIRKQFFLRADVERLIRK